jgi:heme iron utilization protein
MTFLFIAALLAAEPTVEEQAYKLIKDNNKTSMACTQHAMGAFGSVMPFLLDKGRPVVFISDLAEHTKNINKDSRASIFVMKDRSDFDSPRATIIGKFVLVPKKEIEEVKKAYIKEFPQAKFFAELHDFQFYRLEITGIYYVGGFGPKPIQWLDIKKYQEAAK